MGTTQDARILTAGISAITVMGTVTITTTVGDKRHIGRRDWNYGARGPDYHRGGYIPYEYRNRQYVVNNWRDHHLNAPPRGQQWVQVGSDYVLIGIATGIIAQLVLSR